MNEWLLFNTNSAICQLYHGKNKSIFIEMMLFFIFMIFILINYA